MRVAKILVFTGDFGSGKSNLCSYMAVQLAQRYRSPLWANYDLKGSIPIRTVAELHHLRGGVLALDELHDTVDSRNSAGMNNKAFLEWFMQSRKMQTDILICTQVLDQIDKRVRRMCKAEFCCTALTDRYSEVKSFRLDLDGAREKPLNNMIWDRQRAYGLYDHLSPAWSLASAEPRAAQQRGAARA